MTTVTSPIAAVQPRPSKLARLAGRISSAAVTLLDGTVVPMREIENRCLDLVTRGKSYAQIADELNIRPARVGMLIGRATARSNRLREHDADRVRDAQVRRIDALIEPIWGKAIGEVPRVVVNKAGVAVTITEPDNDTIRVIKDLEKFRAELLGTYAPKRIETDNKTTLAIDEQLRGLFGGNTKVQVPLGINTSDPKIIDIAMEAEPEDTDEK